jgi:hypothetical protein
MSVDSGAGVAVMSAQKPSAAKMGHASCHKTNAKSRFKRQDRKCPIGARHKHDKTKRRTAPQPSRIFDASLAHYSLIRIA